MTDTLQAKGKRLTIHILIAMVIGAVLGVAMNLINSNSESGLVHSIFIDYGANGIFHVVGKIFVALLQVLVVPLVFVSLVNGTAALEDIKKIGRIGLKTFGFYLMTTALAITFALAAGMLIGPGKGFGLSTDATFEANVAPSFAEVVVNIFPKNVVSAMSEGNMLQIIVFAILLGIAINMSGKAGEKVLSLFKDLNEVVLKLVWIIMLIAPYGVFALIAKTFAIQGYEAFGGLIKYFLVVLAVLIIHGLIVYPILIKLFSGLNPLIFLKKIREVQLFAFSTASSNATIPITLNTVETKLGVKNSIASFSVPLGATINMDGTAIMQGVATVFIAQAYGLSLDATDYLMVIVTATLASIGTAGVPGVGLILLSMVLNQVGLPIEGIGLILGIDRLLDMVRTAINVTGDSAVSCIVAKSEGELDESIYNSDV